MLLLSAVKENLIVNGSVYVVERNDDKVSLRGIIPVGAVVICLVNNIPFEHSFPLHYKTLEKDGNTVFEGAFIINDRLIKHSKEGSTSLSITIDGVKLKNVQPFICNSSALNLHRSRREDPYQQLLRRIALLEMQLLALRNKEVPFKVDPPIARGMVPVITDPSGTYMWDYPFAGVEQTVEHLAKLVKELADANIRLNLRVQELESKVHDHINAQYIL